jgi:hypothetical protein
MSMIQISTASAANRKAPTVEIRLGISQLAAGR